MGRRADAAQRPPAGELVDPRRGRTPSCSTGVRERLDDDLDTPGAIRLIDDAARHGQGVLEAAALLGVDLDLNHVPSHAPADAAAG